VTQLTNLDFEAIENAVMETARGRWFLSEYKKRHSTEQTDTPTLLDAINRLEKVITNISHDLPSQQKPKKIIVSPPAKPAIAKVTQNETTALKADARKTESLTKENLQFFAKDEDMFTDAPVAPTAAQKGNENPLTSFKVASLGKDKQTKDSKLPDLAMQPTSKERDRIVVIRNASTTDINIPLAEELQDPSPAEKSKSSAS